MTDLFDLDALRRRLAAAPDAAALQPLGLQTVVARRAAPWSACPRSSPALSPRADAGPVAVLSDQTPKRYRSADLLAIVTGALAARFAVRSVTRRSARPRRARRRSAPWPPPPARPRGAACLVAVGSGTVTDIGKAVAAAHGLPYAVVQTADSVNGFADDRSVLLVSGVKRTTPTTWADALVVDTDVLVDAPAELNVSGFADLIATFTAPADWYLATLLGMDDVYLPTVVALAREQGGALLAAAPLVPRADRAALERVAATLTLSGISMGIAGTTAPCSGMEHAVGHLLEMATLQAGGEPALHGAQVGARQRRGGAAVAARPRRAGRRRASPRPRCPTQAAVEAARAGRLPAGRSRAARWARSAGATARASWRAGPGAGEHVARAARDWADARPRAARAARRRPRSSSRRCAAPARRRCFAEVRPPVAAADARWAVASCHLMRERFSVADLACFCWASGTTPASPACSPRPRR